MRTIGAPIRLGSITFLAILCMSATPATAETSKSFQVSASIVTGCIVTTDGGAWGTIDFGTASGVAQGSVQADLLSTAASGIQIDCTPGTTATLSADGGNYATNGVRAMARAGAIADTIPYQLYADASSTPWTTQPIAISTLVGTPRRIVPIRGDAALSRPMAAGRYTDTVRVTLSW